MPTGRWQRSTRHGGIGSIRSGHPHRIRRMEITLATALYLGAMPLWLAI